MGRSREDLTKSNVRFWSVQPFLVVYLPAARPLEIVRVLHGAREISRHLKS